MLERLVSTLTHHLPAYLEQMPRLDGAHPQLSHARLRLDIGSHGPTIWSFAYGQTPNALLTSREIRCHHGKRLMWCRLRQPPLGMLRWLELSQPDESDNLGFDALVFKVADIDTRQRATLAAAGDRPVMELIFQAKSAEDILAEKLPA